MLLFATSHYISIQGACSSIRGRERNANFSRFLEKVGFEPTYTGQHFPTLYLFGYIFHVVHKVRVELTVSDVSDRSLNQLGHLCKVLSGTHH